MVSDLLGGKGITRKSLVSGKVRKGSVKAKVRMAYLRSLRKRKLKGGAWQDVLGPIVEQAAPSVIQAAPGIIGKAIELIKNRRRLRALRGGGRGRGKSHGMLHDDRNRLDRSKVGKNQAHFVLTGHSPEKTAQQKAAAEAARILMVEEQIKNGTYDPDDYAWYGLPGQEPEDDGEVSD